MLQIAASGGVNRPKILTKILRLRKIALILAFVGAYFYSEWCFHPSVRESTRISEHSLMPALVKPKFDKSGVAIHMYRKLTDLPKSKSQQQFIQETFSSMGLESYTQKWNSTIAASPMSGENVYGFVRGHRNDGAEAQLTVVQLGSSESARRMISRVLAFVDYAKEQVYWSRDLVFVFVDGGKDDRKKGATDRAAFALDAFLLKYQKIESISSEQSTRRAVSAEEIQAQTGAIIAGIVYDLSGMKIKGTNILNIQTNGINGQQVNLDVFNGIAHISDVKYFSKVAVFGTLHRHAQPSYSSAAEDNSPFAVALKALYTQAFVQVEGIHSVMGKYGVQGLTVGLSHDFSERETGQFIEEVSRMLNNALERLHQSYFMYILSDDIHFTSIGFYMPVIGILVSPLLIAAYYEWTTMKQFEMPFNYLVVHCIGFLIYLFTSLVFMDIGIDFVLQWMAFPFFGAVGSTGAFTPPIPLLQFYLAVSSAPIGLLIFWKWPVGSVKTVRFLVLLEASLILGCLALINFGLAVFSAAATVPIVFMMTFKSNQRLRSVFRTTVLTILSPMAIVTCLAAHAPDFFGIANPEPKLSDFSLASRIIHKLIRYHVEFGTSHFFLLCVAGYPVWNMLFATAMHWNEEDEDEEEEDTVDLKRKKEKKKKEHGGRRKQKKD